MPGVVRIGKDIVVSRLSGDDFDGTSMVYLVVTMGRHTTEYDDVRVRCTLGGKITATVPIQRTCLLL
jgi:hypothetical protein